MIAEKIPPLHENLPTKVIKSFRNDRTSSFDILSFLKFENNNKENIRDRDKLLLFFIFPKYSLFTSVYYDNSGFKENIW